MATTKLSKFTNHSPILIPTPSDNWPLHDQFVGIEIEIESPSPGEMRNHIRSGRPFWAEHQDGSLRNGIEYVLSNPLLGAELEAAIDYFFDTFKNYEITPRTSIHVHMNMRQETDSLESLQNLCALYYMFEDSFFAIADMSRKWCSYCNSFEDNPPKILQSLFSAKSADAFGKVMSEPHRNNDRYYGLNLQSLTKYGTVEFRHMPCVRDRDLLKNWIKLIMELKKAATKMAEAGESPFTAFANYEQVGTIVEKMPQFGQQLLDFTHRSHAFRRLQSLETFSSPLVGTFGGLGPNAAFARFLKSKTGDGSKPTPRKRAPRKTATRPLTEDDDGTATAGPVLAERPPRTGIQWHVLNANRRPAERAPIVVEEEWLAVPPNPPIPPNLRPPTANLDEVKRRIREQINELRNLALASPTHQLTEFYNVVMRGSGGQGDILFDMLVTLRAGVRTHFDALDFAMNRLASRALADRIVQLLNRLIMEQRLYNIENRPDRQQQDTNL